MSLAVPIGRTDGRGGGGTDRYGQANLTFFTIFRTRPKFPHFAHAGYFFNVFLFDLTTNRYDFNIQSRFAFIMETENVYCAVRNETANRIQVILIINKTKISENNFVPSNQIIIATGYKVCPYISTDLFHTFATAL